MTDENLKITQYPFSYYQNQFSKEKQSIGDGSKIMELSHNFMFFSVNNIVWFLHFEFSLTNQKVSNVIVGTDLED